MDSIDSGKEESYTPHVQVKVNRKEIIESPRNKFQNFETKNIGKFVLTGDLGEGTFGKVKIGHHVLTGEKVAIKVLEKKKIIEIVDKNRVEREIKILKTLRHKNIIQIYCVIQTATNIYLIMEYANGNELFNYIVNKKRLSEQESCEFFQQLISGVEYLHKFKIVHRDIKPENIILDSKKTLKIIDFGLSNMYKKSELLNTQCGSPCYAAPEMISGNLYKGENIDVWSSGITLFAMVCGFLPFEDTNNDSLYRRITEGKFTIPQFLSDGVKDLIRHVLTVDPDRRYKIADIKLHPWFGIVHPPKYFEGLKMDYHIMPIEEKIIQKMAELDFKPEEVRLHILANKHSHISTTYYLLLKRDCLNGLESCGDLCSYAYKQYIEDARNLLHNYNKDINIIVRERCYKPPNLDEDIRYIPINYNNNKDKEKEKNDQEKNNKRVSFNNQIHIVSDKNELKIALLIDPEENNKHVKNAKEKFIKLDKKQADENSETSLNNQTDSNIYSDKDFLGKFNAVINKNRSMNKKKSPSQVKQKAILKNVEDTRTLISDRHLNVSIKPFKNLEENQLSEQEEKLVLNKIYPKISKKVPDETVKVRGKPFNFKTNFIDTSMSFENIEKINDTSDETKYKETPSKVDNVIFKDSPKRIEKTNPVKVKPIETANLKSSIGTFESANSNTISSLNNTPVTKLGINKIKYVGNQIKLNSNKEIKFTSGIVKRIKQEKQLKLKDKNVDLSNVNNKKENIKKETEKESQSYNFNNTNFEANNQNLQIVLNQKQKQNNNYSGSRNVDNSINLYKQPLFNKLLTSTIIKEKNHLLKKLREKSNFNITETEINLTLKENKVTFEATNKRSYSSNKLDSKKIIGLSSKFNAASTNKKDNINSTSLAKQEVQQIEPRISYAPFDLDLLFYTSPRTLEMNLRDILKQKNIQFKKIVNF